MRNRRTLWRLWLLLLLISCLLLPLRAEEGHFDLSLFLGQLLNFVVLFGGLALLLRTPIRDYLQSRSEKVARQLEDSENLKKESLKKLEESEARLKRLKGEIEALKAAAEAEALKESARIKEEAGREVQRLKKLAQEEIDSLVRVSLKELKAYTIELSVALAENQIRQKLTPALHRQLINRAIEQLRMEDEWTVSS